MNTTRRDTTQSTRCFIAGGWSRRPAWHPQRGGCGGGGSTCQRSDGRGGHYGTGLSRPQSVTPSWSSTRRRPAGPLPIPLVVSPARVLDAAAASAHRTAGEDAGVGDGSHLGPAQLSCPGGCRAGCAQPAGSPALRQPSPAEDGLTATDTVRRQAQGLSGGSRRAPPLARVAELRPPTHQAAATAKPAPHRAPPGAHRRSGLPGTGWVRPGDSKAQRSAHPPPWRSRWPGELPSNGRAGGRTIGSSMVRSVVLDAGWHQSAAAET